VAFLVPITTSGAIAGSSALSPGPPTPGDSAKGATTAAAPAVPVDEMLTTRTKVSNATNTLNSVPDLDLVNPPTRIIKDSLFPQVSSRSSTIFLSLARLDKMCPQVSRGCSKGAGAAPPRPFRYKPALSRTVLCSYSIPPPALVDPASTTFILWGVGRLD
jgi:hypothetical protein